MSTLEPDEVHVWTLAVTKSDQKHIKRLAHVLCPDEIDRLKQITHKQSKREYQAAHILCRMMLSNFSDLAPADWLFTKGEYGRPEINEELNHQSLRFNISHTNGLVACALSTKHDIGIDVEWRSRSNMIDTIAKRNFSNSELSYFKNSPPTEQRMVFFSFWTLKESYIKAIGKGLHEQLDSFAFDLDTLEISFLRKNDIRNKNCWSFNLFTPSQEHLCALCVAHPNSAPKGINYRHIFWHDLFTQ